MAVAVLLPRLRVPPRLRARRPRRAARAGAGLTLTGGSYSVMLITPNGLETDSGLFDLTATAFESLLPRLDLRSFCLVAAVLAGVLDAASTAGRATAGF